MSIVLDGSNLTTTGVPNSGTAVASTSGTSIDFTGIPAGTKRITVMFNGVSTNGSSTLQIQIGSGSITTTGYSSVSSYGAQSSAQYIYLTTGFALNPSGVAGTALSMSGLFQLVLIGSNTWAGSGSMGTGASFQATNACGGNSPSLGGTLDRVRITTVNGTDTFDAGSINILYE